MKIQHLMEGAEPKMPGAPSGIQIMTPQQFVAKAGDMPGEESEEGVTEVKAVNGGFPFDVDHMHGSRGIGADWADTRDLLQKPFERYGNYKEWYRDVNRVNSELLDDNAEFSTMSGGKIISINGKDFAFWSNRNGNGSIDIGIAKKHSGQGVAEGVRDLGYDSQSLIMKLRRDVEEKRLQPTRQAVLSAARELAGDMDFAPELLVRQVLGKGVAEANIQPTGAASRSHIGNLSNPVTNSVVHPSSGKEIGLITMQPDGKYYAHPSSVKLSHNQGGTFATKDEAHQFIRNAHAKAIKNGTVSDKWLKQQPLPQFAKGQGVSEGIEQLNRIRKLSGLEEATKLPASSREFGGDEFQDYMKRIVGTPDVDKAGNVKTDKKGNEKYVSGKTKSDRYKMPYIHRSSVIEYVGPDGKTYDEGKIKQALAQRPKSLLKQNEKMKHSNGEFEQFFNVGFAALTGIALDEDTNKLIIVNTCPGAGSCKVDCFAMKGGKVQFKAAWLSDGRILTYLLNDPDGFFNQLSAEISKEEAAGQKGDKKFPNGWQTTVRWHDAGDFFSPEYLDLALKMAAKHPDTKFYAYTKMAGAALGNKPPNFIINWSEGAHTSQEKQVKASDANLDKTKNSRIVPDEIFQDLLVKDEKKNLVKGEQGQWQVQPDKLPELKQRLAKQYGLSANSILDYNEYMAKRKSIPAGMKYNVIVAPGEGDISANDPNIISTLLLKH